MLDFSTAGMEAVFARFRGAPDAFGPFSRNQFGGCTAPAEFVEHAALHYAVAAAGPRFRMISLGAAPGEWVIKAERLYRKRFPAGDYRSISLEADAPHFELTKVFLRENGADLNQNIVQHAVVSPKDGFAYFPIINSDVDWGAGAASFAERKEDLDANISITAVARADRECANGGKPLEFTTIKAISLRTLLEETGKVNFIHCDIQGAEGDVFPPQMEAMRNTVLMCCISTHGTKIERRLIEAFQTADWTLAHAHPCHAKQDAREEVCLSDGAQIWVNPHLS